jgi:hypothetical protein
MIAFYYGLTGFSCVWYYRKRLTQNVHNFFVLGVMPLVGAIILYFILGWSFWYYWNPANSYTMAHLRPHLRRHLRPGRGDAVDRRHLDVHHERLPPAFFRGETLTRDSPTLVTEDYGAAKEESH